GFRAASASVVEDGSPPATNGGAPERRSVRAAELPVIPGDDAGRREAQRDALLGLLEQALARLGRRRRARGARRQPQPHLCRAPGVALDRHVALEHPAAALAVPVASGLD